MKILHVSHLYHPSVGGNQIHNQMISEKLAEFGEDVHVFTSHALDMQDFRSLQQDMSDIPLKEQVNGVSVQRFKINYKFISLVFQRGIRIRGAYRLFKYFTKEMCDLWGRGPVCLGMLKAIKRLKPDIILAMNNYCFTAYICYLAKKLFGIPVVFMPITHAANPWTIHPCLNRIFNKSDAIVACTDFEKKFLIDTGFAEEKKITTVGLGIDPQKFEGANCNSIREKYHLPDAPMIAYFGRIVPEKGIEHLVDSMKIVWEDNNDVHLILAGKSDEDFTPELTEHMNRYSTAQQKKIIQIDNFDEADKKHLYDAIDIMIMPSNIDCFGIVYLEAWACGKPVIACKNTPQETIIKDGEDGVLVEYGNVAELGSSIIALLRDDLRRKQMGDQGRENTHSKIHIDHCVKKLLEVYHQVLINKGDGNEVSKIIS